MKKNVALLMGGYSSERSISHITAEFIAKNIDQTKYNLYIIDISKNGWYYVSADDDIRVSVNKNNFTINLNNQTISFDVAYLAIHGTPAEDGLIQGYLTMLNIPYVACNTETSSITFNKYLCKQMLRGLSIKTAKDHLIDNNCEYKIDELAYKFTFPVVVKPNKGGSSIGTTKVNEPGQLNSALKVALKEDSQAIIEEFVEGREFSASVFSKNNELIVLPITEIISSKSLFDFDSKYNSDLAKEITPAEIPDELLYKIKNIVKLIYKSLQCKGVIRVDFIIRDNDFYFLEVNTIPGQTQKSIVLQQLKEAKYNLSELYSQLIEDALSEK